jgi:hypothetical protein
METYEREKEMAELVAMGEAAEVALARDGIATSAKKVNRVDVEVDIPDVTELL